MTYQVFVERPSSSAPDALDRLAAAMAQHYGLAQHDLEPRLRAGRFRVKANVDRATAEQFAADLEQLGAVVSIVDEAGAPLHRASATAAAAPAAAPIAKPAAPAPAPAPAPVAKTASQAQYHVGLAAALDAHGDEPDLGALGDVSGSFALSALDGSQDEAADSSGAFAPPAASANVLPASIGPAIAAPAPRPRVPSASPATQPAAPVDMFAPPAEDDPIDLAVDIVDVKPKRAAVPSTPPPAAAFAEPVSRGGRTTAQPPLADLSFAASVASAPKTDGLGDKLRAFAGHERARFAAGCVLAVLVGFLPAHVLASVREHSAYAEIDARLAEKSSQVRSIEAWQALDQGRDAAREEKVSEKLGIAVSATLLWAAVAAGFAFVWFRKIDWDRLARG